MDPMAPIALVSELNLIVFTIVGLILIFAITYGFDGPTAQFIRRLIILLFVIYLTLVGIAHFKNVDSSKQSTLQEENNIWK